VLGPIERDFFYLWSGRRFPFLNVEAVASLRRAEPESPITVYFVDERPLDQNVEILAAIPGVSMEIIDAYELFDRLPSELVGVSSAYSQLPSDALSARSNLLRYALLFLRGGIYLDFDTLVTADFDSVPTHGAFVGVEFVWSGDQRHVAGDRSVLLAPRTWAWALSWCLRRVDSLFLAGRAQMCRRLDRFDTLWRATQANNAVIGSCVGSEFLRELLKASTSASTTIRYETGPHLVDRVLRARPELVTVVPRAAFYSVSPGETYRLFEDVTLSLPDEAILVHYASSNHPALLRSYSPGDRSRVRVGSIVDRIVTDDEGQFDSGPHRELVRDR
jgi:hypothetical protein